MVKAVTLGFQVTFYREVCAKFVIPNSPQSPVIGQNSDGRIFDFHISGQSLINKIVVTPEPGVDMKLGPVTKLDKRNWATSEKFDDDIMLDNCEVFVFLLIYDQFAAIWKPDS